ncbi:MAG: MFS transporter [Hyphomonadaceae bacterium]|nr:MFS transporter [Hyphomonadaceae bacterium]
MEEPRTAKAAGAGYWPLLALISGSQMLISIDITLLGVLLPSIGADLGIDAAAQAGILSFYALVFASLLLIAGRCADIFGQRTCCLVGLCIILVGTVLAAMSRNFETLLLARVLQGGGSAILVPANFSLINTVIPDGPQRRNAYGVFGMVQGLALLIGPAAGGALATQFGWQAAFFAVLALVVVLLAAALKLIPKRERPAAREPFDVLGALLFVPSVMALIVGLSGGPGAAQDPTVRLWLAGAGLVGLAAFALIESRVRAPLLPLDLFRRPTTITGLLGMMAVMAAAAAFFIVPNLVMQRLMGFTPGQSGLGMIPHALAGMVMGQLVGFFLGKLTLNRNILLGFTIIIAGALLYGTMQPDGGYIRNIMLPMLVAAGGSVFTIMVLTAEVTLPIEPERQGVISALAFTCQQIGISLGATIALAVAAAGDDPLAAYNRAYLTAAAIAFIGLCAALFAKALPGMAPKPAPAA